MNYTKAQEDAIYKRGGMVLVSAAAGSGKTAVLTERVLQFVLSGGNLDRLLVVTFTVKAAAQMREKISNAINDKLASCPDNIHLLKQSILVHKAKICTIDSLFGEIVRNNFYKLDISNNFKFADEIEISLLEQQIASDLIDDCYEDTENFELVCDLISDEKTDDKISELIIKIFHFLKNIPFEEKWLDMALSQYEFEDASYTLWVKYIIDYFSNRMQAISNSYINQIEVLQEYAEIGEKFLPIMKYELTFIYELLSLCKNGDLDEIENKIRTIIFDTSPTIKGYTNHPEKIKSQSIRSEFKDYIKKLKDGIFAITKEDIKNDSKHLLPILRSLVDVVRRFNVLYNEAMLQKNILSFSDITKLALSLLVLKVENDTAVPTELALELSSLYDEVLIDEYQDTNDIQDLIFSVLSNNQKNLFVVGDIRQSIYSFRNACPEIFLDKQNTAKLTEEEFPHLINLADNFRSRDEIIAFINFFFGLCMIPKVGDVDYKGNEELIASSPYPKDDSKYVEINLINYKEQNTNADDEETEKVEVEANFVANKIATMLQDGYEIFDIKQNCYRKATPSDFVILLRSTKHKDEIFKNALEKVNVPVFCDSNSSYFEQYEIQATISILTTIDNPYNDIALASTLRCPCFGFTNDDFVDIRIDTGKLCFYDALKLKSTNSQKYSDFLNTIEFFRIRSRELPIYRFLMLVINELSLMRVFGGMDRGESRQSNLNQLCRYAKIYEDSGTKGLYGFISFIKKAIDKKGDLNSANSIPSSSFVNILSIHKSKGLEFPIVFLSSTSTKFNNEISKEKFLIDKEFGFGCKIRDIDMGIEFTTIPFEAILQKAKAKQVSEEMRILYVAATRAKDKLIITSTIDDTEKSMNKIATAISNKTINQSYLQNSKSFIEWINAALFLHPDATYLTKDLNIQSVETTSNIQVNIIGDIKNSMFLENETSPPNSDLDTTINKNIALKKEIFARLAFKYSKSELYKIPSKLTVSEIKSDLLDDNSKMIFDELSFIKPSFVNGKKASEIGTAVHKILQYCDNIACKDISNIEKTLDMAYKNHIISESVFKEINRTTLHKFFTSELCNRMNNSNQLFKEYRFTVMLDIQEYFKIKGEISNITDETILLQGVIDCFFIENNQIILIDYKTDYAPDEQELIEKYKLQLDLYKKALETVFKLPVCEKIIYSFYAHKAIIVK